MHEVLPLRATALSRIAAFRAQHAVGKTEFGRLSRNNRDFILYLEKGHKGAGLKQIERAEAFMAAVAADPAYLTRCREALLKREEPPAPPPVALGADEAAEHTGDAARGASGAEPVETCEAIHDGGDSAAAAGATRDAVPPQGREDERRRA